MPEFPNYVSDELFHFVGFSHSDKHEDNYETLKTILADGWISYWPHAKDWGEHRIDINWDADMVKGEFLIPTVTCFADIPYECLGLHGLKYGQFGLSIDRSYLVNYHARPVMYLPYLPTGSPSYSGRDLITHLKNTFIGFEKLVVDPTPDVPSVYFGSEPRTVEQAIHSTSRILQKQFLAYLKPFNALLGVDNRDNYYMEREWRKFGNLQLQQGHVRRIVVHPDFVEKARHDFQNLNVLISPFPTKGNINEELTIGAVAAIDTLAKLLFDKGIITQQEFLQKLNEESATYQAMIRLLSQ